MENQLNTLNGTSTWQQQVQEYLAEGDYLAATRLYEEAIEKEPDIRSHYWYLGLMLLLQGKETEAQLTWLMVLNQEDDLEHCTLELIEILETEAERRTEIKDFQLAYVIRKHISEIAPDSINNLLHIIQLSIELDLIKEDDYEFPDFWDLIATDSSNYDVDLFFDVINNLMRNQPENELILHFVEKSLQIFPHKEKIVDTVMKKVIEIGYCQNRPRLGVKFGELCLNVVPNDLHILPILAMLYQNFHEYVRGIEIAKYYYEIAETTADKLCASGIIIRGLIGTGCSWQESLETMEIQQELAQTIMREQPLDIASSTVYRLFNSISFLPYFYDNPQNNHFLQNQISSIAQKNQIRKNQELFNKNQVLLLNRKQNFIKANQKKLKIGYISHCFKKHSVGWLSRWLFQHHNPEKFEIYIYYIGTLDVSPIFIETYFIKQSHKFSQCTNDIPLVEEILKDEIDILVDLDSITLDLSCGVMSLKPAPIQVTWLGWDASGIPSIDYFIADPYVLPESAQDYYSETIWRLPQTYIAVDGFEVDIPNLKREDLDIPNDAIVYFMTQTGAKRHEQHLRLQMRILKEVPNSYLLIKGKSDIESSKKSFESIAQEEGIDFHKIKFLPFAPSELIHRANLQIADVVLDTYPYNGATTTLETLWMGIPVVTKVGEQFAARNSYTMMINAGITEGIAWSDEEYVEWGVRLGKDENLRKEISWKLREGRKTQPLWNAKKFTREMEKAYEQMWERYVNS